MGAAHNFLTKQVPLGTSVQDAIERLKSADADCANHASTGEIKCQFSMQVHPTGGTLGEVIWEVNLSQDDQGRVSGVAINRTRTGMGDD
jgi:hypothetical protein